MAEENSIRASASAPSARTGKDVALELYDAAIAGAAPGPATARATEALPIERSARIWLFAVGKAAQPMAAAAVASLLRSLYSVVGGVVVSPDGGAPPYPTLVSMRGDHPIPGRQSNAAAAKIGEITPGRRGTDVAIVLVSGGASSLIAAPIRGLGEADLSLLFEQLLGSGLSIDEMNAVRKRFTRWGAGRLALALAPAATHCLAMSDVPGDDLGSHRLRPLRPRHGDRAGRHRHSQARRTDVAHAADRIASYLTGGRAANHPRDAEERRTLRSRTSRRVVVGNNRLALDCGRRTRETGVARRRGRSASRWAAKRHAPAR